MKIKPNRDKFKIIKYLNLDMKPKDDEWSLIISTAIVNFDKVPIIGKSLILNYNKEWINTLYNRYINGLHDNVVIYVDRIREIYNPIDNILILVTDKDILWLYKLN